MSCLPENIRLEAESANLELLPEKSKVLYDKEYLLFKNWKYENAITENSEEVFMAYFSQKARKYKSSSLWAHYSMLKSTMNIYEKIDIGKFCKLTAFLKKKHVGYVAKKSSVFTREDINKFLSEASDDEFLLTKIVAVIGIAGGCRCDELVKMCVEDVQVKEDFLLIHIPITKTHKKRSFTILADGFGINPVVLYRKYLSLRPKNVSTNRLFLTYRNKKCTVQPVGINTIGKMTTVIANYLHLENPETYTGHAFRRAAATLLADCGADIMTLKRFGGWKSDKVAEGYVEDSLQQKVMIGKKIQVGGCYASNFISDSAGASAFTSAAASFSTSTNGDMLVDNHNVEGNANIVFGKAAGLHFHSTNCTINVVINERKDLAQEEGS